MMALKMDELHAPKSSANQQVSSLPHLRKRRNMMVHWKYSITSASRHYACFQERNPDYRV
ncbi:hypothetical protein O9992_21000 [Vibrio lentus]|nr:hypothetical protein [Vibrio lentus]